MNLEENIIKLYESIETEFKNDYLNKIKFEYTKQFVRDTGSFTITFEIVIINKILDEDYGLVLATNAQQMSHFDFNLKSDSGGLFLISDLYYGNNKFIDSTEELIFNPFDDQSVKETFQIVEKFILGAKKNLYSILTERYDLM